MSTDHNLDLVFFPILKEIPDRWTIEPAHAVFSPKKQKNTNLIETQVLSLSYGKIVIKPVEKLHGLVPESFETYQIVTPGDIIIRTTDLQNDKRSLRVGIVRDKGIITSAYMCLRTDGKRFLSEYGYQVLNSYDFMKIFYGYGSGLRQNLDFSQIRKMPIPLPPLPEQKAIVKYLDYMDHRIKKFIRNKQKMIKLLEEQKQAIIHQAVTRGLDPHVKLKPSGVEWLGEVPEGWEVMRLKDISSVQSGLTLGKDYSNVELKDFPYLRVANVQTGALKLNVVKTVKIPIFEAEKVTLQENDVLMTEGGDIDKLGRGCVWKGEIKNCLHQNHIFAVRCKTKMLLPQYLATLTESQIGRDYFQLTANQTTNLASTNITKLKAFPISVPPLETQIEILNSIDKNVIPLMKSIKKIEQEISLLQEYRTRLISDVVTGKVDVREAAKNFPEEPEYQDEDLVEDPDREVEYDSEDGESEE